jgi:hypothetical protein
MKGDYKELGWKTLLFSDNRVWAFLCDAYYSLGGFVNKEDGSVFTIALSGNQKRSCGLGIHGQIRYLCEYVA